VEKEFWRLEIVKRILITGALGQIGTELTQRLRKDYGIDKVIASNRTEKAGAVAKEGLYENLDVLDGAALHAMVKRHRVDTVIHLASILSAKGEEMPQKLWEVNMQGLYNVLEVSRQEGLKVFFPSSIAVFGAQTPRTMTPQVTLQRPGTIYGVSKVSGELLCDYYHTRFGVDTRGVRFPGLISREAMPGGGTTDYAVHIYHEAVSRGAYTSYIARGTRMDMLYMPDAIQGVVQLMETDPDRLHHRNAYNITAMSLSPEEIAAAIRKRIEGFEITYEVDPVRQAIADSWPDSLDDSVAREEWGWNPKFGLEEMTGDMLEFLKNKKMSEGEGLIGV